MIPSQFEYAAPATLNETLALLAKNPDAKALAGGHSLLPVMKLRLSSPSMLVDLRNVAELRGVEQEKRAAADAAELAAACSTH